MGKLPVTAAQCALLGRSLCSPPSLLNQVSGKTAVESGAGSCVVVISGSRAMLCFLLVGCSETQELWMVPVIWEWFGEILLKILNPENPGVKLGYLISATSAFAPILLGSPKRLL